MNPQMTFQDWLNECPNNEPDKVWNLQYVQKLSDNIEDTYDYVNVPDRKGFLI